MWHRCTAFGLVFSVCLVWAAPARAREEALVDKVRKAINSGVGFLRDQQTPDGNWEVDAASAGKRGGWTSLAMLALLNSGIKPGDPMIQRGLKWLRGVEPADTYVVGLQTMVFTAAGEKKDLLRIQRNVDWLIDAACRDDNGNIHGWSYKKARAGRGEYDNSNTQYALLGLHEGHLAGAKIKPEVWKQILKFYTDSQNADGSWGYSERMSEGRLTMTTAGLCGLIIAGMELNKGREQPNGDGTFRRCGEYDENVPVRRALDWLGSHFRIRLNDQIRPIYYNLYGIERAGRLSGQRFLGRHDWYREGCQYLVEPEHIREDGSWTADGQLESWPVVSTSFALLFLSKGRTPVLISKLVHGPGEDWNNDRNDARHLVEFASKELFTRQPLAWQVFDAKHALGENQDDLLSATSELLQSPIAYFNGHRAPQFGRGEEELLKKYLDEGGFILAEACCGREEFGEGFHRLIHNLFDDDLLQPLPADHPIWTAHYLLSPRDFPKEFKLYGVQQGCKTVVVFSPKDLSCYWESNRLDDPETLKRFQLGANIIAYATGMELPKPRLTEVEVTPEASPQKVIRRGFLKVGQVRHDGDWAPAPRAMYNLMRYLHDKPRLDVEIPNPAELEREGLRPSNEQVLDHKFLYMAGRNVFRFDKDQRAIDNLRSNLQTGGLLLADASCGRKEFDASFRHFMGVVFKEKPLERIPLNDELFSKELNGRAIKTVRCRRERADGSRAAAQYRTVPPFLEGIKHNGRWVVIYSKYDLGCALEHTNAPDCLGHDYDSALKLATAAVLYAIKR